MARAALVRTVSSMSCRALKQRRNHLFVGMITEGRRRNRSFALRWRNPQDDSFNAKYVAQASLEAVCCEAGKAISTWRFAKRTRLPWLSRRAYWRFLATRRSHEAYGRFLRSLNGAGEKGEIAEDLSRATL